jgi:mRNA-degrading endonuclease RelE of RelBE toxin-antitoxin system
MKFDIRITRSADGDLDYYEVRQQKIVLGAVERFLRFDADIQSKRRKRLGPNPLAPWELRIGDHRVFYEIEAGNVVRVLAIGHKVHNELVIRGGRTKL